jgi:hypothetical protein
MVDLRAAGDPGHSVSQQRVFGGLALSSVADIFPVPASW